jgi:hypothetical protein
VPRPAFEVFGLAEPSLPPGALAESSRANGVWDRIGLAFGDWSEPAGPWLLITSSRDPDYLGLGTEADLLRAIEDERDRIAGQTGVDEDEPEGPPEYAPIEVAAGGESLRGLLGRHGNVWVARVLAGGPAVTLVGRGIDPRSVRLAPVTDLAPYLRRRGEMIGQLSERRRRQAPPVLPPASGVAAYWALAEAVLEDAARQEQAFRAGRSPRHRAVDGAIRYALWQRAVREQARISGIGERAANEIGTLVVNHLTHLQLQFPWFTAEPALREAASDETLRHAVLGQIVPSGPAQAAWASYWTRRMNWTGRDPGDPDVARAHAQAGRALRAEWVRAWSAWARAAGSPG